MASTRMNKRLLEALQADAPGKIKRKKEVMVYLSEEEFDKLTEFCQEASVSKSQFFRTLLNTFVKESD